MLVTWFVFPVLKEIPTDFDAFHSKIVSLLNLSRFDEAIKLAKQKRHAASLRFELAYAQYRLGRLKESLATVNLIKKGQSMHHLHAQIVSISPVLGNVTQFVRMVFDNLEKFKPAALPLSSPNSWRVPPVHISK